MAIQMLILFVAINVAVCSGAHAEDPFVSFVRIAHQAFLTTTESGPNTNFTYGLETHNVTTGITKGTRGSRFGVPDKGIFYTLKPGGELETVDFTVDTPGGFRATKRREVQTRPVVHDYGRNAAPLAYTSRPAPEGTPMMLIKSLQHARSLGPIIADAYKVATVAYDFFQLKPPHNVTMGYQQWNGETGQIKSQYGASLGQKGEGRVVVVERDGTQMSMTIAVNDTGFFVTTPVAYKP